jgi:hypothetical protein
MISEKNLWALSKCIVKNGSVTDNFMTAAGIKMQEKDLERSDGCRGRSLGIYS